MNSRYLYHNFPRRPDPKNNYTKGEAILKSIERYGLLLTPELITCIIIWPLKWQNYNFTYVQQRVCFTELAQNELAEHSKIFGNYALEFTIESGRDLGAVPVFYIPTSVSKDNLSDLGTIMIHSLGDILQILDSLESILKIDDKNPEAPILFNGNQSIVL